MKVVLAYCENEALKLARKYLKGAEVRCINESDENFLKDANVLITLHWKNVKKYLPKLKSLKMIQALSAGVDHIPIEEIPDDVILCSNAGSNAWAVAELAFTLLMISLKKSCYRHELMKNGKFPQMIESKLLREKKVGILGFGHIGQSIARMLSPFNVKIYAFNRKGKYNGDIKIEQVHKVDELGNIAPELDVLILALPLTRETEGIINKNILKNMKKDGILVNVARGKLIVEKDFFEFLKENSKFTAALDAWWHYGRGFTQKFPFEKLPNVVMSPHCGGIYENWIDDTMRNATENVMRYFRNETPKNIVR